jgi:uncharacterized protein RhaS with RHS repeats
MTPADYYNPTIGRFTSEDPIGLNGGINLSLFVSNNPIYYIDPLGLIIPGSQAHHPPGWNEHWQWRPGSREDSGMHWWDDKGGEWRWHPTDNYHTNHWDHNPWEKWNSPEVVLLVKTTSPLNMNNHEK